MNVRDRLETVAPDVDGAAVWAALSTVIDPEIGVDIVTLGLVYGVQVAPDVVVVTFTLTTPGCPLAEYISDAVAAAVRGVSGGRRVEPRLVWEPRWSPAMIPEGAL